MLRIIIAATLLTLSGTVAVQVNAQESVFEFKSYKVSIQKSRIGKPLLKQGTFFWNFRTRIRNAAKQPVNFAGHYIVTQWDCGTDCQDGVIIDALTGSVTRLPLSALDVSFKINSRLFIVDSIPKNIGHVPTWLVTKYYVWHNNKFLKLKPVVKE